MSNVRRVVQLILEGLLCTAPVSRCLATGAGEGKALDDLDEEVDDDEEDAIDDADVGVVDVEISVIISPSTLTLTLTWREEGPLCEAI